MLHTFVGCVSSISSIAKSLPMADAAAIFLISNIAEPKVTCALPNVISFLAQAPVRCSSPNGFSTY